MKNIVLRGNATPIYAFLSLINARLGLGETLQGKKVLDCAAGGPVPPLVLFYQHGFEAWGIDVSDAQLQEAQAFCREHGLDLNLRQGDMRQIPFDDETFDYVYEHYSMCHLGKSDTARAVQEMYRVLKKGGLCFLGVISTDSWPMSVLFGQERSPGEFWSKGRSSGDRHHSAFTDAESDDLVSAWEIVGKEKWTRYFRDMAEETSVDDWMDLYSEAPAHCSLEAWRERYAQRVNEFYYTHTYYYLRKSV